MTSCEPLGDHGGLTTCRVPLCFDVDVGLIAVAARRDVSAFTADAGSEWPAPLRLSCRGEPLMLKTSALVPEQSLLQSSWAVETTSIRAHSL